MRISGRSLELGLGGGLLAVGACFPILAAALMVVVGQEAKDYKNVLRTVESDAMTSAWKLGDSPMYALLSSDLGPGPYGVAYQFHDYVGKKSSADNSSSQKLLCRTIYRVKDSGPYNSESLHALGSTAKLDNDVQSYQVIRLSVPTGVTWQSLDSVFKKTGPMLSEDTDTSCIPATPSMVNAAYRGANLSVRGLHYDLR